MDEMKIVADGVTFEVFGETTGDVKLSVNGGENVYLAPATAHVLGLALISIATKLGSRSVVLRP